MAKLTNFERVSIQMEAVVPIVRGLQEILGEDVVNEALAERLTRRLDAIEPGHEPDFDRMAEGTKFFAAGDALEYDIIAATSDSFDMNVTNCRYAEMMDKLGARDIGHLLVCGGDFAGAKRIGMELTRTQTRMQGASHCDFRYRPLEAADD